MRYLLLIILSLIPLGCAATHLVEDIPPNNILESQVNLTDLGEAPEISNEMWINTEKPLRLQELRGNVVLIEMWTFG